MELSVQSLVCGANATGLSTIVSLERGSLFSDERTIVGRVLINVGDSTQRFCSDNRIKLGKVSVIIISSLAPHNVSGLPGVLLSMASLVGKFFNTFSSKLL